ncbi:shikimate dehydrogenase [Clostridium tepidiprofundi DSM 19306]|uniref:Shikimate dehydrogenase (NADP(+)) n=1 Tax=Clostridium tepidiprofundi DSM 19306 TaxID=1121338 RepID=A0A151B5A6_9CLOT|nr:shikimate dehydrogenase [Clostridium tepidiprofundi]KYH34993.1 shikimate dehydrogenase [Clostridium tepidiprofundi DSM 19306]
MEKLYGLLGEKLGHSLSPQIHSMLFDALNIDAYYHLFEIKKENLRDALYGLKALNVRGVNVTIPYKVDVIEYLDDISEEAKKIGAVNTIHFINDKSIGYNTDYYGFGILLEKYGVNIKNSKAVVLGTGGASKAIVQYLSDNGAKEITLVSRNIYNNKEWLKNFRVISYDRLHALGYNDIVINCTPCGMYPYISDCPIRMHDIYKFRVAIDLVYNPSETVFLSYAKHLGLKAISGSYMLVGQAAKAQEIWNSVKIKPEIIEYIDRQFNI